MNKAVDELRPRSFGGIVGQEKEVAYMQDWVENKSMPNIIMSGPPGSGKTTACLCLCSGMLDGYDVWDAPTHKDYLRLNASDERGIDVVRTKLKDFAFVDATATGVPFRIIVLEEGDQLTKDAQQTLRFVTEAPAFCRFIFVGNDETYIKAIKSRCAILRFHPLPVEQMAAYFDQACEKYGIKIEEGLSHIIATYYEGDMRAMFNDTFEKIRFKKNTVTMADLDLTTTTKAIATEILALLLQKDKAPNERYWDARKKFTSAHGKERFDLRDFLLTLEELMGDMSFDTAEYFSDIDDRLRSSERNKEVHVGALLALIARGGS